MDDPTTLKSNEGLAPIDGRVSSPTAIVPGFTYYRPNRNIADRTIHGWPVQYTTDNRYFLFVHMEQDVKQPPLCVKGPFTRQQLNNLLDPNKSPAEPKSLDGEIALIKGKTYTLKDVT